MPTSKMTIAMTKRKKNRRARLRSRAQTPRGAGVATSGCGERTGSGAVSAFELCGAEDASPSRHYPAHRLGAGRRQRQSASARERRQGQRDGDQRRPVRAVRFRQFLRGRPRVAAGGSPAASQEGRSALSVRGRASVDARAHVALRLARRAAGACAHRARASGGAACGSGRSRPRRIRRGVRSRSRFAAPGLFVVRFGGGKALHAAAVRALNEAAARRIGAYWRLSANERIEAIAKLTGADAAAAGAGRESRRRAPPARAAAGHRAHRVGAPPADSQREEHQNLKKGSIHGNRVEHDHQGG